MAKIKTIKEREENLSGDGQINFSVRIPKKWVGFMREIVLQRKQENGYFRMADLVREVIYQGLIKPINQAN